MRLPWVRVVSVLRIPCEYTYSSVHVDVTIEYSLRRHLREILNSELEGRVLLHDLVTSTYNTTSHIHPRKCLPLVCKCIGVNIYTLGG